LKELDLGVTFSRNMKFSNHIKIHVNKATGILSQLKRSFRYWTLDTCRTLYCAYVRPHLEYAPVVWSPPSKKDARLQEKVQRRATKLVPRIRNWRNEDRLAVLGLTSLHERRLRGDLIQLFKLVNGINEVNLVTSGMSCPPKSQMLSLSTSLRIATTTSGQLTKLLLHNQLTYLMNFSLLFIFFFTTCIINF